MKIETVSTAARHRRASFNSGQFTPTVLVTPEVEQAITNGELRLKRGQWIISGDSGLRGQFVKTKKILTKAASTGSFFRKPQYKEREVIEMRPYVKGRSFADYQRGL